MLRLGLAETERNSGLQLILPVPANPMGQTNEPCRADR
jgi:hypothetical protein